MAWDETDVKTNLGGGSLVPSMLTQSLNFYSSDTRGLSVFCPWDKKTIVFVFQKDN